MASIWDTLFPRQDYRTPAPSGGYADLYANGLLGNRTEATAGVSAMQSVVPSREQARFLAEMTPILGDAMSAKELWDEATSESPNWALVGALGGATVVGLIPGLGDAAAKAITSGAKAVANAVPSDLIYAGKSLVDGDMGGVLDALTPGGEARSLSAAANQDIPRQLPENNVLSPVDSLTQADLDAATPFTRTSGFDAPRVGGGRAKDPALSNRYSKKKQIGVPPSDWSVSGRRLESKIDAPRLVDAENLQESGFTDLFGFVADGTMANTVIDQINGVDFPRSVMQQGGHEFGDNKNALAFMSDGGAMSSKAKVWDNLAESGGRPAVTPMTMGAAGGDFSMHQAMDLVQMIQGMADNIDPNFVPLAGAAKNNNRLLPEGMGLLSPELPEYVAGLNGGQRAALMKSLDTAPALAANVPSVGAVRWAATDPNLAGLPSLSSGYRIFEPKTKDFFTLPGNHASYDTAVDRVGENMTMGNDLRPWYLQFPDEAYPKILASTPSGANMLNVDAMPKDIRGFQMNPKMSQAIDNQYVDTNMKYNEIARTEGKEQADLYAIDALVNRAMMSGKY